MTAVDIAIGILIIVLGSIYVFRPELGFRMRTFLARKLFDLQVQPGKRTYAAYRIIGAVFIAIGLVILLRN